MKSIFSVVVLLFFVTAFFVQGQEKLPQEEGIIEQRAGTTPDSLLYVVDKSVEDIILTLKSGEEKAAYALEVKEEKIAEAFVMVKEDKSKEATTALNRANTVSDIVATEVGLKLEDQARKSSEISKKLLEDLQDRLPAEEEWQEIDQLINSQMTQEEKIKLATQLVEKVGKYCDELAKLDFELMVKDPKCDPKNAPEWLQEYIKKDIKKRQKEAEEMMISMITTCVNDPRQCDCDKIPVKSEQHECKQKTQLAIKCEFEQDLSACQQLEAMPVKVPETMPDFLKPIFERTITQLIEKKKKEMFAKFAPPECVEAGVDTREGCEKVMIEKYAPKECKEAGAFTREACEAIMIKKYGQPPAECVQNGKYLSKEECQAILIKKYNIPNECVREEEILSQEECMMLMMPAECKNAGARTPEECEAVMREKIIIESAIGPPAECMANGAFIGQEECDRIMTEKFSKIMQPQQVAEGIEQLQESLTEYERTSLVTDVTLIPNPETGELEPIPIEEVQELIQEQVGEYLDEEIAPTPEVEQLRKDIEELQKQQVEIIEKIKEGETLIDVEELKQRQEEIPEKIKETSGEGTKEPSVEGSQAKEIQKQGVG